MMPDTIHSPIIADARTQLAADDMHGRYRDWMNETISNLQRATGLSREEAYLLLLQMDVWNESEIAEQ